MNDKTRNVEKDGVIYTPSDSGVKKAPRPPAKAPVRKTGVKRKKKPQKSQISVFLAATLFTGIVVVIVIFALVFAPLLNGSGENAPATNTPAAAANRPQDDTPAPPPLKTTTITGLVKAAGEGRLDIYDLNTGRTYNLFTDSVSLLNDKFGKPIVFAEIKPGSIVDVEFADDIIRSLYMSRLADERSNATVTIDPLERRIEAGSEVYTYNEHLVISGFNEIGEITSSDLVRLRIYKNVVWYMELTRGHGYVEFTGKDGIIDGVVQINNDIDMPLSEIGRLELKEADNHRLVIKGANIDVFADTFKIVRNETTYVDLSQIELVLGRLEIIVNQTDYTVYINGEEADTDNNIDLLYGKYAVVVDKQGYVPWEGEVEITGPVNQLVVKLEERVLVSRFEIVTFPVDGAEIYIDSAFVGISPCVVNIEYGTRTITYKKEGYKSVAHTITLNSPTHPAFTIIMQEEDELFMPEY